ncbi:hydroxyethylthiazole kinase [Halopenitus sp. H-Gu1]|uniref:hydroxyethylthiazole kinase n=1 Tax=Halopenitus sp. H-Gu1 TaxID=3242697 RepID=UPI00359EAA5C
MPSDVPLAPDGITGDVLSDTLAAIAKAGPLVQHLTNEVTMSETANITLHWNGLPVMADAPAEAGEMAAGADAVLCNTGRMTDQDVEAMIDAGTSANGTASPVVLDPVGYGATSFRVSAVDRILEAVDVAIIKGNRGEIAGLAGETATVRGVESVGEHGSIVPAARALADETGAVVVASGETDVVATAESAYELAVGHERMGSFVGTGCMLGSTLAIFGSTVEDADAPATTMIDAALLATIAYGLAGEHAGDTEEVAGPASYRTAFMDAVAALARDRPTLPIADRIRIVDQG